MNQPKRGNLRLHFTIAEAIDVEIFDAEWKWLGLIKHWPLPDWPDQVAFYASDDSMLLAEPTLQNLVDKLMNAAWAGRL